MLVWWTHDQGKLSKRAREICRELEDDIGYISTISLWELGWKIKLGRLDLGMPIERYVQLVKSTGRLQFVPVDEDIWLGSVALDWQHRDPSDRTIIATARKLGVPLLTKDRMIHDFLGPEAIW